MGDLSSWRSRAVCVVGSQSDAVKSRKISKLVQFPSVKPPHTPPPAEPALPAKSPLALPTDSEDERTGNDNEPLEAAELTRPLSAWSLADVTRMLSQSGAGADAGNVDDSKGGGAAEHTSEAWTAAQAKAAAEAQAQLTTQLAAFHVAFKLLSPEAQAHVASGGALAGGGLEASHVASGGAGGSKVAADGNAGVMAESGVAGDGRKAAADDGAGGGKGAAADDGDAGADKGVVGDTTGGPAETTGGPAEHAPPPQPTQAPPAAAEASAQISETAQATAASVVGSAPDAKAVTVAPRMSPEVAAQVAKRREDALKKKQQQQQQANVNVDGSGGATADPDADNKK